MIIEHLRSATVRGKPKYNMSKCYSVHYLFYMERMGIETGGLHIERPMTTA
jgi:hypothetical protein